MPDVGRILGDPARIQQIVWNLLTNAIKFTPAGGYIEVTLERLGSELVLRICDTGKGIDAAFLPYVFDKFRQADLDAVRRQGSLGLWMTIVKQLVERHQGTVTVSSPGLAQGATFTLSIAATTY